MRFKWNRLLAIPLLIIVILAWVLWPQKDAEAGWYDDNWLYRLAYDITNSGSAISAERKIKLDIDTSTLITAGKLQSDCDDARFTDASGKLLDYFIDTDSGACNTNSTDFYIKVPSVLAGKQTLYFYYGNSTAPRGRKNDFFATDTTGQALKAYYKMDETTANTCIGGTNDTCDYALTNDGAWNGDVAYTASGKVSGGTTYDGSGNDYIAISDTTISSAATVTAWFTITDFGGANEVIIGGTTNHYLLFDSTNFYWRDSGGISTIPHGGLTFGVFYHVAVTQTGGTATVYLNGTSLGTGIARTPTFHSIGGNSSGTWHDGKLDDVRIYSRALTSDEITSIYNSGNGQSLSVPLTFTQSATAAATEEKSPGPVAAWSFDEGTGTTGQDSTAGNNDGTLTGGPVWKNESECISGKCLYFDGSDDYVDMGDPANNSLDVGSDDFTMGVWAKVYYSGTFSNIMMKGQPSAGTSNPGYQLLFRDDNSDQFQVKIGDGTTVATLDYINTSLIADSKWHYFSVVKDSSNIYLYIDSILVKTQSHSVSGSLNTNLNFRVGSYGGATGPFEGFIDEPRLYKYARTAAQIKADYAARGTTQGVVAQVADNGAVDQLSNGLVAYYPMDEASANSCTGGANDTCDKSGNGNDGAWNGNAANTTGKYGSGTSYDGTGDSISFTRSSAVQNITNEGTISLWTYYSTLPSDFQTGIDLATTGANGLVFFTNNTSNKPALLYGNGSTLSGPIANSTFTTGRWYHLVGTWSPTGGKMYVNGVLDATSAHIPNISVGAGTSYIGSNDVSRYHNGALDEVRIYNRALSPAEVSALYEWAPGPVAHWKLDENTGTSASDVSGNGINSSSFTGSPAWKPGKYGSALDFSETTNQAVAMSANSLFDASNVTFSAWIYPRGNSSHSYLVSRGGCSKGRLSFSNTNYLQFEVGDSGTCETLSSSSTLTLNQWHHITGTLDGTSMKIYVNGVLSNTATMTITPVTNNQILLGNYSTSGGGASFDGLIDDVRVYNYALNSKQIMSVMNGGSPAEASAKTGPVAHWSFDEGYGTTAYNKIRGNGDLTFWKGPSATDYPLWKNAGKFGKALQFSSSEYPYNNAAYTAYQSWMNSTNNSWNFWMYPTNLSSTSRILSRHFQSGSGYVWEIRMYADEIQIVASSDCTAGQTQALNSSNVNLVLNTWQHIIVNHESGTGFKIYKNGILTDTIAYTAGICTTNTTNAFYIGTDYGVNGHLDAYMDEVKIYPYALSAQDVALEYNGGKSLVLGAASTAADGTTADNSSAREYCVPGDTTSCAAPVAEWKLDEGTGTTGNDTSGNGNTATFTNISWNQGKYGKGLLFTPASSTSSVADSASISLTTTGTISGWIKSNRQYPSDSGTDNYRSIVNKWASGSPGGTDESYLLDWYGNNTTGYLRGHLTNGTDSQGVTYQTTLTPGRWYYVTYSWDGTTHRLYMDGTQVGTASQTINSQDDTSVLRIGSGFGGTDPSYVWDGTLDNVRIYNYARTPAQIAWEYNKGAPVAHYRLDECQGTTAYNSALNGNGQAAGNNGTITIGASGTNTSAGTCTGSSGEAWKDGAIGKIGASLEFDGSDDYVNAGTNLSSLAFQTTNSFSTSAWIYPITGMSNFSGIVQNQSSSTFAGWNFSIYDNDGLSVVLASSGTDKYYTYVDQGLALNTWNHVLATYDGSGNASGIKIYINGVIKTLSIGDNDAGSNIDYSTSTAEVGRRSLSGLHFNGQIDDVRIYNYALTPAQVRDVYNGGAVSFK